MPQLVQAKHERRDAAALSRRSLAEASRGDNHCKAWAAAFAGVQNVRSTVFVTAAAAVPYS